MEHVACTTLLVLTLSQLCRAEILQILPGPWFSANAISNEFSPKPISELFTPPPSSTEPQNFPVTQTTYSVTESPSTIAVKQSQPSFSVTEPIVVLSPVTTPAPSSYPSSNPAQSISTSLLSTFSTSNPSSTPLPIFSQDLSSIQYTPTTSQTPTFLDISSFTQPKETPTINIVPPSSTPFPTFATQSPPTPSTPFLDSSLFTQPKETPTINIVPPSSTPFPTFASQSPATPSTASPSVVVVFRDPPSITPIEGTSTISPITPRITTVSSSLASTAETPTITTSKTTSFSTTPQPICRTSPFSTTRISSTPTTLINRPISTKKPSLMIRVVAPMGSITNVKINPTTSTQRPRTKRTSKPKRNTYDGCIQSCRGRKDILCSIPLSSTTIDPKNLKSFPSICHMACHNSYRSPAYEMLVEGRCSRLRTRIMTVGSNTKLKRDELKKTEYSIVNTGQGAVVEFSNGPIRK